MKYRVTGVAFDHVVREQKVSTLVQAGIAAECMGAYMGIRYSDGQWSVRIDPVDD